MSASCVTSNRHQSLIEWLEYVFPNQKYQLDSLHGDASFRRYHRLTFSQPTDEQKNGYIVMDAPPDKESLTEFVAVAQLFAPYVNVPDIIAQDMSKGFLVLQDFGQVEFAHLLVDASNQQVNDYYQWAMQTLAELQRIDVTLAKETANLPFYDKQKLLTEMFLFTDWFLPYIHVDVTEDFQKIWQPFCQMVIEAVLSQPQVVVHRDYHSRNLMQDQADSTRLGVIDFQDAVIGAYTYDLVSLLRDAYVDWQEEQVSVWIQDFLSHQPEHLKSESVQAFTSDVAIMGVQRHLKVLGIFIRLSERDGKKRYLADIPKVMKDLMFELQWLANHAQANIQDGIKPVLQWFHQVVLPAYQKTFCSGTSF